MSAPLDRLRTVVAATAERNRQVAEVLRSAPLSALLAEISRRQSLLENGLAVANEMLAEQDAELRRLRPPPVPAIAWPPRDAEVERVVGQGPRIAAALNTEPACGHSACRQHWIDTGESLCVDDGCPKGGPECIADNGDRHNACEPSCSGLTAHDMAEAADAAGRG